MSKKIRPDDTVSLLEIPVHVLPHILAFTSAHDLHHNIPFINSSFRECLHQKCTTKSSGCPKLDSFSTILENELWKNIFRAHTKQIDAITEDHLYSYRRMYYRHFLSDQKNWKEVFATDVQNPDTKEEFSKQARTCSPDDFYGLDEYFTVTSTTYHKSLTNFPFYEEDAKNAETIEFDENDFPIIDDSAVAMGLLYESQLTIISPFNGKSAKVTIEASMFGDPDLFWEQEALVLPINISLKSIDEQVEKEYSFECKKFDLNTIEALGELMSHLDLLKLVENHNDKEAICDLFYGFWDVIASLTFGQGSLTNNNYEPFAIALDMYSPSEEDVATYLSS